MCSKAQGSRGAGVQGRRGAVLLLLLVLLVGCGEPTAVPQAIMPAATATLTAVPPTPTTPPNCAGPVPGAAASAPAEIISYSIVNTYPHDTAAFTQGLQWVDGVLFEGAGQYGASDVRRVDLESGEVLRRQPLADNYFGEGVTVMNGRLYQLTWREQTGFVYDPQTLVQLDTFTYETEGWGLTHNGRCLIMSDGSSTLTFRDPQSFAVLGELPVFDGERPVTNLNELEYVDGLIFANVWLTDFIAVISAQSGQVVGWLDLTEMAGGIYDNYPGADWLNGVAYMPENGRFLVTGKYWPFLYEIEISGLP